MNKKLTTDIYLAASLMSLGATLESVDKSDPRHMVFELDNSDTGNLDSNMDLWENQYVNGVLMVNAFKFKDSIQRLKSVVHTR